ncbi:MAG TPA: pentapeptide repeat-containing protein [Candidatus Saccharimonadales bacterium]|nr:pentapeptide repeat-containing protein [Candidatus Saccharimonadales bacterium]
MITPPLAPRLPTQLDDWNEPIEAELELDGLLVRDANFTDARRISIDGSKLVGVVMAGAVLDKFECSDTELTKLEAAGVQAYKANFLRVTMADCRLTGAELAEATFEDCVFKNVKFDEAGFRFAHFTRVRFENCMLRAADFSNAQLKQVVFTGCDLEMTSFMSANCKAVDVTGEDLAQVKGILGLKGATVSTEQLILLAPLLATELGFVISE